MHAIVDTLEGEGFRATRPGIAKLLRRIETTGSFEIQPESSRPSHITPRVNEIVEAQMTKDDETIVAQLCKLLHEKGY